MPTAKPRITVTLDDKHHSLLARVAQQQGKSMSALIVELVTAVSPSYERLYVLMDRASKAKGQLLESFSRGVERAEGVISDLVAPSTAQSDLFERAARSAADRERRAERSRGLISGIMAEQAKAEAGRAAVRPRAKFRPRIAAKLDPRPVITGVTGKKPIINQGSRILAKKGKKRLKSPLKKGRSS